MKKLIIILSLLFINCQEKENQPFSLKGEISNYPKDYLILVQDTTGFGLSTKIDSIKINKNGQFYLSQDENFYSNAFLIFENNKPFRITLSKYLVEPINIAINNSKPDSIIITGEQAPFVQYYLDQQNYWRKIYAEMANRHPVLANRNNQKLEYHRIQDTITKLRIEFLENYFKSLQIENQSQFIDFEKKSLIYSNLYYRMSGQEKEIIERLEFYNHPKENSTKLTYSDKVVFTDKSLFSINSYREFTFDFIMNDIRIHNPNGNQSSYEYYLLKGLDRIDKWFTDTHTNSIEKVIFINELISKAEIFNAKINIDTFSIVIDNLEKNPLAANYLPILNENLRQLEESTNQLSPGDKAPNFQLLDRDGNYYRLSDIKNKTVLIDVWASWCRPCISSFPKWNDLVQENRKNKNIVFLAVSIDDKKERWKKGLEKYDLNGIQLFAGNGGFNSDFAKEFKIKALPKYIAIDSIGNIISFSPSFADFKKIITEVN